MILAINNSVYPNEETIFIGFLTTSALLERQLYAKHIMKEKEIPIDYILGYATYSYFTLKDITEPILDIWIKIHKLTYI